MKKTNANFDSTSKAVLLFSACFILLILSSSAHGQKPDLRRISFNENWRFQKDDPSSAEGILAYEKIKDWVRTSGNEYVLTSDAVKSVRPSENIGEDVTYTRQNFDDSAWRQLNLPHDWAIEGDFIKELSGETGKRPFAGIGWYRKHFTARWLIRRFGSTANLSAAGLTVIRRFGSI
jgi:beta-galactosidase